AIRVGERAPAPKADSHRLEEFRADLVILRVAELVARIARLSDDTERHGHGRSGRQPARQTDRTHAGHILHAVHDFTVKLRDLRRDSEMRSVASRAIAR